MKVLADGRGVDQGLVVFGVDVWIFVDPPT